MEAQKVHCCSIIVYYLDHVQKPTQKNKNKRNLPSLHLQYFLLVFIPLYGRVTKYIEELAPQLQVSRGIWEWLPSDLPDNLGS